MVVDSGAFDSNPTTTNPTCLTRNLAALVQFRFGRCVAQVRVMMAIHALHRLVFLHLPVTETAQPFISTPIFMENRFIVKI
jgi:hypothetical protein